DAIVDLADVAQLRLLEDLVTGTQASEDPLLAVPVIALLARCQGTDPFGFMISLERFVARIDGQTIVLGQSVAQHVLDRLQQQPSPRLIALLDELIPDPVTRADTLGRLATVHRADAKAHAELVEALEESQALIPHWWTRLQSADVATVQATVMAQVDSGTIAPVEAEAIRVAVEAHGLRIPRTALRPRLMLVPAGRFLMGGAPDEFGSKYVDRPQHPATLSQTFWVAATPVTRAQFSATLDRTLPTDDGHTPRHPVGSMTWYDAVAYCNRLSTLEGLEPAYVGTGAAIQQIPESHGYRLPTEAEWEYACRAGTQGTWWFGTDNSEEDRRLVNPNVWYLHTSPRRIQPVGLLPANPWGLYDTHGNVGEWCQDWIELSESGYAEGYPSADAVVDPRGPASGRDRILRGGSVNNTSWATRAASRHFSQPDFARVDVGFRVVRTVVISTEAHTLGT
ncbi:MAG: sulfatase activating formylglycine-generating enzyme, partial [Myxococcota bacterium]